MKTRPVDPPGVPPPPPPPEKLAGKAYDKKVFWIVLTSIILLIITTLYNVSRDGMFGLSAAQWNIAWAISENGMLLLFSILQGMTKIGIIRYVFRWVFIPLFTVKLIYHISCFAGVYLLSPHTWEVIWSFACGAAILTGVILLIKKFT